MTSEETRQRVLKLIDQNSPRPTELIGLLNGELSYSEVQDVIAELIDCGQVELDSGRRLRIPRAA